MKLQQKTIVITGGTSGIGYETVRQLQEDNTVWVIAGNAERLQRLAAEFSRVRTVRANLASAGDVEDAAAEILKNAGHINLLINNAAVQHTPALLDAEFRFGSIAEEIAVNFTSLCQLTALLLPSLLHEQEAAIVNVNSSLGLMPKTGSAVYCATKGAVNIFSQSLRYQLEATNVTVMQAFMPLVDTRMTKGRGQNKLSAADAAAAMIAGIERNVMDHDIGKVRVLRALIRIAPSVARRLMRAA